MVLTHLIQFQFIDGASASAVAVVVPPVQVRGGGSSDKSKKGKRPRYWWEKEEELVLPYRPPEVLPPKPVPMHIVYDDPGLRADAKAEIEVVYKRKKRKKQMAEIVRAILDD